MQVCPTTAREGVQTKKDFHLTLENLNNGTSQEIILLFAVLKLNGVYLRAILIWIVNHGFPIL